MQGCNLGYLREPPGEAKSLMLYTIFYRMFYAIHYTIRYTLLDTGLYDILCTILYTARSAFFFLILPPRASQLFQNILYYLREPPGDPPSTTFNEEPRDPGPRAPKNRAPLAPIGRNITTSNRITTSEPKCDTFVRS